jgi:bifunctional enzyme CysN/CysC
MRDEATSPTVGIPVFLEERSRKTLLRVVVCSVADEGKSTLVERLIHGSNCILEDRLLSPGTESRRSGKAVVGANDLAPLLDRCSAHRDQGATCDVAYRFFETDRRKFIVAEAPGHEQQVRNIASGASSMDVAILIVDASKGLRTETRLHAGIVALLEINHIILAVNNMELVGYDESVFCAIEEQFEALAERFGSTETVCIPVSALKGDNVFTRTEEMSWFEGPPLMHYLEKVDVSTDRNTDFRFPVQWVNRPHQHFRGLSGTVAGGYVSVGQQVRILPSGRESTVDQIVTFDGNLEHAEEGDAVTIVLADDVDAGRGDIIVTAEDEKSEMAVVDQFQAQLFWMNDEPLIPGRSYRMRTGTAWSLATVTSIKYRLDLSTGDHIAAKVLGINEAGTVTVSIDRPIPIDTYSENSTTGAFVMIDRQSNAVAAAGMVTHSLRRATNVVWHDLEISKTTRAEAKAQEPRCIWFTGLSGSGKSTIANCLDKRLSAAGKHSYVLDGDNVRHGLNRDLGFTEADRVENIRRVAEVAKLMVDAGLIVLVCAISPFREDRQTARSLFEEGEFIEVFVNTPIDVCEARDPKGLYEKARSGIIPNFTGISAPYEEPVVPEIVLDHGKSAGNLAEEIYSKVL